MLLRVYTIMNHCTWEVRISLADSHFMSRRRGAAGYSAIIHGCDGRSGAIGDSNGIHGSDGRQRAADNPAGDHGCDNGSRRRSIGCRRRSMAKVIHLVDDLSHDSRDVLTRQEGIRWLVIIP